MNLKIVLDNRQIKVFLMFEIFISKYADGKRAPSVNILYITQKASHDIDVQR